MFEAVELDQAISKAEFKHREPEIRAGLLEAQRALRAAGVPVLIIVAGVEGAGKGAVVNRLHKWLDTRGLASHAFWDATDEDEERPRDWRFWRRLPGRGEIGVMFGAWYWRPLYARAHGESDDADLDAVMRHIAETECMLHADGMLIIKLWFHLSRKTHKKRMKKRREVQAHIGGAAVEGQMGEHYVEFLAAAERSIQLTDSADCPWLLIEAENRWFRDRSVAEALLNAMHARLEEHRAGDRRAEIHETVTTLPEQPRSVLDKVDLSRVLSDEEYREQLKQYQECLHRLVWRAYDAKRSSVIVFEGWDAAGKGGAIRRLTAALDARLYRVISVAAPSDEELAHHYLWRFWRQVPRAGYMTLYDRSWYGRVLVERVEGFASQSEWMRAYREINDFEDQLVGHGTMVHKFWLHISPEEQLRRFREREQTVWKQHKITREDWRNREKWLAYRRAVNAMVEHTSTARAPWTLVAADDKKFARVQVLKTLCERFEQLLAE